ncbi:hypothetical protein ACFWA9_38265 [Kitasatospora sp. NPDC059973]|uniref:hypothetical protein n=1 Tax=Kitasatospora sp. NPDC059973 TaxID=3347020 RepID=UPI0036CFC094
MGIHYTTAVVPAERSGADTDNAVLIFAADLADDIPGLPLPVALHVVGNELGCFGPHAQPIGPAIPVSDDWLRAASPTGGYDAQARVCVVLEPLSEEAGTGGASIAQGVDEPDLPSWVGDVVAGRYRMAMRPVRVSTGSLGLLDVAIGAPTTLTEWAALMHTP